MDMNFIMEHLGYSWSSAWTHVGWISKASMQLTRKISAAWNKALLVLG